MLCGPGMATIGSMAVPQKMLLWTNVDLTDIVIDLVNRQGQDGECISSAQGNLSATKLPSVAGS